MTIQFKLVQSGPGAITRRVTFAEQPTWFSLASRIEQLYGIPLQDVGVSYVDSDGDVITLSTHEELQDYYATVLDRHNDTIKFTVKSIGALRSQNRPNPPPPSSNNNNMYEIIVDEDWQSGIGGIPLFPRSDNPPPPPPKSPSSAFVETVDSSVVADPVAAPEYDSDAGSVPVFVTDNKVNVPEGERSGYEGIDSSDASSVSVIHDDMPDKQPVHVLEFDTEQGYVQGRPFNSHSGSSRPSRPYSPHLRGSRSISRSDSSSRSTSPMVRILSRSRSRSPPMVVPAIRITTPPSSKGTPPTNVNNYLADPPSPVLKNIPIPDPPLPTAGASSFTPTPSATLPSLGNDVAELLSALTTAFSSHPELSEGLKNIVRNASQGAYWAAERDVMVNDALRAAGFQQDGMARAAQHAQEEAGRKVSEALNGVFRSLGSIINSTVSQGSDRPQSQEGYPTAETQPMRGRSVFRSRSQTPNAYNPVPTRFQSSPPPGDSGKPNIRRVSRSMSRSPSPRRREDILPRSISPPPRDYLQRILNTPPARSRSPPSKRPEVVLPQIPRSPPARRPDVVLPRPASPPPRDPQPFIIPPPPLSGHYESRRTPSFYYGHYPPGPFPPPPPRPHRRYHLPGPPPPPPGPPPPGPPPRSSSPMFSCVYPGSWAEPRTHGEHQGLNRSSTLPSRVPRIGGIRSGPDFRGPLPPPPVGTMVASGSARRKAELEEAKQYYKAKKDEWRREKEARRLEKERRELQRMERMRERERRAGSTRHVVMFDSAEEVPPPIPPHPAELMNSSPPLKALGEDVPFTTHTQRPSGEDMRHGILMRRLAGMGFTPKTHSHLEVLVAKHLKQLIGSQSFTQETVIANLLEELFHPQAE